MKKIITCAVFLSVSFFSISFAHDGATGVVKQRMDMMSDVASSMKTLGQMLKGEVDYNADTAQSAALKIEKHSKHFLNLFPEGSTQEPREALPAVWENWDDFKQQLEVMANLSNELATIAASSTSAEEIKTQFSNLGKTCGMCHKKYRQKK